MSLLGLGLKRTNHGAHLLTEIRDYLKQLTLSQNAYKVEFYEINPQTKEKKKIMALTLTDIQKADLAIAVVDAKGNPAAIDGAPVWEVSDSALLTVTPSADGLSCTVAAVGPLGVGQVKVTVDADLGPGVASIVGLLDVEVLASQAVAVTIAAGVPVNQ